MSSSIQAVNETRMPGATGAGSMFVLHGVPAYLSCNVCLESEAASSMKDTRFAHPAKG